MVFHRLNASQPKGYGKRYILAGIVVAIALVLIVFRLYPM